ncbi:C40 family peptidase [Nakamurella flavida]|uniref:C40 family peptidase n=1 Tax=Nakamurella flavida TaxID=363630 RepID=A0A939C229_9ACTN|nr:C40 family peptidase [Nakamurella flavida]MBM9476085.1 C40 family peptidase [Nakamurella flavida]MDP9777170.1 cell wall-associated NlpC family hydrolase [Nakamurella flavida]
MANQHLERSVLPILRTTSVSARSRRLTAYAKTVAVGTAAVLAFALVPATVASADPATPETAQDAKQAWLDAERQSEVLNEDVLQAQVDEQNAVAAAAAAATQVDTSRVAVTAAQARSVESDAAAAGYQVKVNAFANASFRGARLNQFSAMLTADSADDFLDEVTSLDRVAEDTQTTLADALAAKAAAAQAKADADAAESAAEAAKSEADAAQVAAQQAAADVVTRKAELDTQVASYKALYDSLSEQERLAAIAAEEARQAEANRAAQAEIEQAAAAQAAAAAVAAPRADRADRSAEPAAAAPSSASAAAAPAASAPVAASGGSSAGQAAVAAALSKVGSRYVYGAAGPNQFDCSGLTSWAWAQAGVSIPRTSRDQAGLPSVPLSQLQPGDLVTYYSPVSHVGMYIGNGQIVHASTESKPVYVTTVAGGGPNPTGHRVG